MSGLTCARKLDALGLEIMSAWCSESALKRVLSCQGETPAENSKGAASFEATPSEMRTTTLRYSRIWDHRPQACRRPKSLTSSACCRDAALCWRTPSERIAKHCLSEYQRGSGCRAIDGRPPGAKCMTPLCHCAWPCTDTRMQEHAGKSTATPNWAKRDSRRSLDGPVVMPIRHWPSSSQCMSTASKCQVVKVMLQKLGS